MDNAIVIVGGGLVGATAACAWADGPFRVTVVESGPAAVEWPPAAGFDPQVSALTRASQRVFQHLGVWEAIAARRVAPYRAMEVWDAASVGRIRFDAEDLGESDLGHIVENSAILAALRERLEAAANVEFLAETTVTGLQADADAARLTLGDGRVLEAGLVVGADGSDSWVRDQAGITTTGWDYDQSAVVAVVRTERPHEATARQCFLPTGPVAFLPMADPHRCTVVWSTTPVEAAGLAAADEAAFLAALQEAFGDALGRMEETGPRRSFPLRLQHADDYVRPRIALIGNAAHAIHPLAGQGLNLGVLDAAALTEVTERGRAAGRGPGALSVLRRYERWRKGDNVAVMAAMDGFERLFGPQSAPLRWLRGAGMRLTGAARPVRHALMRRAMGLSGDLPGRARAGWRAQSERMHR